MAQNTTPVAVLTSNVKWVKLTTQAGTQSSRDGTGATTSGWTAGANGSRIFMIRCLPLGTNVASEVIAYINNGSTNGTATNNSIIAEVALAATTATNTAGQTPVDIPIDRYVPNGYILYLQLGTTVAAGWQFTVFGGDY